MDQEILTRAMESYNIKQVVVTAYQGVWYSSYEEALKAKVHSQLVNLLAIYDVKDKELLKDIEKFVGDYRLILKGGEPHLKEKYVYETQDGPRFGTAEEAIESVVRKEFLEIANKCTGQYDFMEALLDRYTLTRKA